MRRFLSGLTLGLAACAALAQAPQPFSFIALGDLPYGDPARVDPPYRALIDRINRMAPAFSIHVGDFKSGGSPCSDEEFERQRTNFERFEGALIYTPGDNEWTDCHRESNGAHDPLERLQALRERFYPPGRSLGRRPIAVENQGQRAPLFARHMENLRWQHGGVLFNTVHLVGSNNNLESRDPAAAREFFERQAANVAWIESAFADANQRQASAMVFAFQADPFDSRSPYEDFPGWSGFRRTLHDTLLPLAREWAKPVLIIHGDSHRFRLDQPFVLDRQPLTHVTRLIVPGASDARAVRVTVQGDAMSFELVAPRP